MNKNYDSWNTIKKDLNCKDHAFYVHDREVWWCSIGLNVGHEQDGKNDLFERPVLVIRKFSQNMFLIVPVTSSLKDSQYFIQFNFKGLFYSVIISQVRVVSIKRLRKKMFRMNEKTFGLIQKSIVEIVTG